MQKLKTGKTIFLELQSQSKPQQTLKIKIWSEYPHSRIDHFCFMPLSKLFLLTMLLVICYCFLRFRFQFMIQDIGWTTLLGLLKTGVFLDMKSISKVSKFSFKMPPEV